MLVITTSTHSQFLKRFSFKFGVVLADQHWDYKNTGLSDLPHEIRWGIDAGECFEVLDLPILSVLMEIHYIQKGISLTLEETTPAYPEGTGKMITMNPRIEYLLFPLMIKIRHETASLIPYCILGPRFDYRIGQAEMNIYRKFKDFDIGITTGIGCDIPLQLANGILIEFRYSPSLTKAYEREFVTVTNTSFEILIGLKL